ncbi:unnamed protein product [Pelagomonas calceolata]|uniref:O-GlcNAc transferase C-terminal domain-containing protein n=1 Tax=Pelagomonas calceolata TaxID=35677 RepID=A0A7S4A751_9STRA|nr:unnamed protein product [Pelagomonas calceolata]|mmetsp:Transcript_457/g.1250  ORF Transcript_457/g.1250 Transcript_457/m.1250 type:complete len:717 (-) Transcript_457:39-2189(-)
MPRAMSRHLWCVLLAAAAHAFPTNDAERTAFAYLINGTEPADGLLEVDAAAAASAHVGMLANSGRIAPNDAALCADRARRAGLPHAAAALFNNVALLCGEIYGGDASCDRGEMYERAHDAAPGLAGVTLNYAYFLEQRDDPLGAARVLRRGAEASEADGDAYGAAGIRVMAASLCQPHVRRAQDAPARYARLLRRLEDLAVDLEQQDIQGDARSLVGNMPIAWPYLGYAFYPLAKRLGRLYAAAGVQPAGVAPYCAKEPRTKPRVAVVAEFGGNTSPGLLFVNVFRGLREKYSDRLELGIVVPEGLDTDFTASAIDAAAFVVYIPSDDMVEAANVIEQARPDVLVYLALGLAHQTYALARRRLARVVLVFGHGHPLTSGLDTVDYFVSSESYERDPTWPNRGASSRHAINAEAAVFFDDDSMVLGASSDADDAARKAAGLAPDYGATGATLRLDAAAPRGDGAQKYEEQLVLFEHSSIGFDEPPAPPYSTRADLDLPENAPVFCVLQHSKKLHPDFDAALASVLEKAPEAFILLLEGARTHVPRFNQSLGEDALEQLIFLPRMSRERVLQVVSQCDAFLDTYPWGGGVTVLESLAMCTPVVVLPRKTTILQLGLGHLRTIGLERDLAARDVDQFGAIAARLGTDNYFRQHMRQTICTRKKLLFMSNESVDEWARFLIHVAHDKAAVDLKPETWPWEKSRELHREQAARDYERGWAF